MDRHFGSFRLGFSGSEPLEQFFKGAVLRDILDMRPIVDILLRGHLLIKLLAVDLGEAILGGQHNLLATSEFVLGPAESLHGLADVLLVEADRVEDGADLDPGDLGVGLAERASHAGLEPICAGAGQHLVDAEYVPGVHPAAHVEVLLAHVLGEVLVGSHPGSLQGLRADLLNLVTHDVDAVGEGLHSGLLLADVVDPHLGVRHPSVVPALGPGLACAEPVAPGWPPSHFNNYIPPLISWPPPSSHSQPSRPAASNRPSPSTTSCPRPPPPCTQRQSSTRPRTGCQMRSTWPSRRSMLTPPSSEAMPFFHPFCIRLRSFRRLGWRLKMG
jgi:hypothetical protein